MKAVTFWKSDFAGETLQQLTEILKQYAVKGNGSWFILHTNFIEAGLPEFEDYSWIMDNVANYGLNK